MTYVNCQFDFQTGWGVESARRGTLDMKVANIIKAVLIGAICSTAAITSKAGIGDAVIQYNLGLAARSKGDIKEAYKLFKKACMASDGLADACLAWGELAEEQENGKDVKRALGSAVMLAPENVQARFALATMLLKKKDYTWAIEHLREAIPHAQTDENKSLLRYYLGYALYKNDEHDKAAKQLSMSRAHLPPTVKQRCDYYRALVAEAQENPYKAASLMMEAEEGPNPIWSEAAVSQLKSMSAFPRRDGFSGQLRASFGINTRAASAVLDGPETADSPPVLQSVFRGDAVYNISEYTHGFKGIFTAYREQNWIEIGDTEEPEDPYGFTPQDFNITFFITQIAYLYRRWLGGIEHQFLIGIDNDVEFLDHMPENDQEYYAPSKEGFQIFGWNLGGKIWWSVAADRNTQYEARLKIWAHPNYIEKDRSTTRFRLRLTNTRHFLDRALRLKLLLGGRYDRSYHDPAVVKFDRLLPELEANLRWRTPVPRLTGVVGGKLKYNWYMNSRGDDNNSFRPDWIDVLGDDDEINASNEKEYYDVTRQDFEWEINTEIQVALWWKAIAALTYKHKQRISNMDDAPTSPLYEETDIPELGYIQDVVMIEIRQSF
ncbi:MAG: hypothetical protein GY847_06090 [Proteobacteria bacterium]|nr:hypothetical protein [Pseudomonadota bacterium]